MTVVDLTLKKEKDEKEFQRRLKIIEVRKNIFKISTQKNNSRRDVNKKEIEILFSVAGLGWLEGWAIRRPHPSSHFSSYSFQDFFLIPFFLYIFFYLLNHTLP